MAKEIKIIIADDHPLLLKGLTEELVSNNYNVIDTATNGEDASKLILKHTPDIAILDIQMPLLNGFQVIKECRNENLKTKFILLTSHKEKRYVIKAKTLNISGYLLKDEPFGQIEKCIEALCNGESYFSKTFDEVYENQISPELEKFHKLSPSEHTIIRLIAKNHTTKDIADSLFISIRTVQKHRTNIITKLELKTSVDAILNWTTEYKELLFIEE